MAAILSRPHRRRCICRCHQPPLKANRLPSSIGTNTLHSIKYGCGPFQTMSTMSVIAAICVSITLSAAIVIVVVCFRHGTPARRHRRRRAGWPLRRGINYAATADAVVACEMEEFETAASFDQCSLSTTVDDLRQPHSDKSPQESSTRMRSTLPQSCNRSVFFVSNVQNSCH